MFVGKVPAKETFCEPNFWSSSNVSSGYPFATQCSWWYFSTGTRSSRAPQEIYRQDSSKGSLCNIFSRGFLGPSAQTSLTIKMNAAPKRKCQKTIWHALPKGLRERFQHEIRATPRTMWHAQRAARIARTIPKGAPGHIESDSMYAIGTKKLCGRCQNKHRATTRAIWPPQSDKRVARAHVNFHVARAPSRREEWTEVGRTGPSEERPPGRQFVRNCARKRPGNFSGARVTESAKHAGDHFEWTAGFALSQKQGYSICILIQLMWPVAGPYLPCFASCCQQHSGRWDVMHSGCPDFSSVAAS